MRETEGRAKSLGFRYRGANVPWRSMTRSNGREVEQSVTVSWRISHVNHEKGGQFESLAGSDTVRTFRWSWCNVVCADEKLNAFF
jgi:hypothetical protein